LGPNKADNYHSDYFAHPFRKVARTAEIVVTAVGLLSGYARFPVIKYWQESSFGNSLFLGEATMALEINFCMNEEVRELLSALTLRVRVFSIPQIARTWPAAVASLKRLEAGGLLSSFITVVHPELSLVGPVIEWRTGRELPDFANASYRLRSRWSGDAVPLKCVIASGAAGRMFGGHGGRYPRESEETHDLHLAAVYLRFRTASPALAASWIHEEEIRRERRQRRGKLPDAIINKQHVIEFGGAYKKSKLIAFHQFCQSGEFEYEVW
jgi:hypothetical protein